MTMFVNLNIVSASVSHHWTIGLPLSPSMPSAMPKIMLNTTICSTSPSAIALMTDSGTMCSRMSFQLCADAARSRSPCAGRFTPTPGVSRLTATQTNQRARCVVMISK